MKKITVFMFIDALGWEIIKDRDFLKDIALTGTGWGCSLDTRPRPF